MENQLQSDSMLSPEDTAEIMSCIMDYYVKISRMVKMKLQHASDATRQRIGEIEALTDRLSSNAGTIEKYRELDEYWQQLLRLMTEAGLMAEEIEKIDGTVERIPATIRTYYDALVSVDRELVALMADVYAEDTRHAYEKARRITATIQAGRNVMSGLAAQDYVSAFASDEELEEMIERPDSAKTIVANTIVDEIGNEHVIALDKNIRRRPNKRKGAQIGPGKDIGYVTLPDGKKVRVLS